MAQHHATSSTPVAYPASVINPCFCAPHPVDLEIFRTDDEYIVADVNRNNIVFRVQGDLFKLHDGVRLHDAAGDPVVTLRKKIMTAHSLWQVFRGKSIDSKDLLFSARKSSMLQVKTKLHVFLASNTAEDVCDFEVKESWSHDSCAIYAGNSSTIVAEMHKKSSKSVKFMVKVHPNMDYAFVVAIILILDVMNTSSDGSFEAISAASKILGVIG
ncbi:Protein LURP-one-related 15 [Morella rubra]|uniref:Protein LURP-one-related 15 n=1 Tax=Morella rubra TaxID=262757 RepID=A0A6A1WZL2_9ROSI|nr:Protein LURP-one-related 15 [Morella rubra]